MQRMSRWTGLPACRDPAYRYSTQACGIRPVSRLGSSAKVPEHRHTGKPAFRVPEHTLSVSRHTGIPVPSAAGIPAHGWARERVKKFASRVLTPSRRALRARSGDVLLRPYPLVLRVARALRAAQGRWPLRALSVGGLQAALGERSPVTRLDVPVSRHTEGAAGVGWCRCSGTPVENLLSNPPVFRHTARGGF